MKTNLRADGEDTILEPGGQLDNVSAIESRPPVDIDKQLDSILYPLQPMTAQFQKQLLKTLVAERVAAAEQQLLTELLGELPEENTYVMRDGSPNKFAEGFNEALSEAVSVIERLQNKTNDGGRDGASE